MIKMHNIYPCPDLTIEITSKTANRETHKFCKIQISDLIRIQNCGF